MLSQLQTLTVFIILPVYICILLPYMYNQLQKSAQTLDSEEYEQTEVF